jgi:hypothetical protein
VTVELQNDLSELKLARITGLNEAVSVQLAMQSLFAHEARRIEAKLGPDDERSKKLTTRSQFNAQALRAMELELQLTRIDAPKVEAEGALVHGRVVDQDDLGIDRLIVCLVDLSGARLDINEATSDDSGYFAISMDSETLARVIKSSPKGVFPAVSTPRGRSIYRQSKPLTLTHGTRLLLEIRLNRTDLTAAPATDTRIAVPDVVGKPEREALATLKNAGLNPTQSETKVSDQVGIVLDQKPAAGSNVVPGTSITLTVGIAETNTVAVPNLVGANLRTAKAKLRAAELNLGTVSGPSPTDLSIIEKQEPEAEAQVPKGTPVNLIVRTAERRARKRRGN